MNRTAPTADYTVLARRFRPQSFQEVIGQEHVAQALRNAIAGERVAHAYLFTGARGVGKTSTARILAKSLNCPNALGGDPCNECEMCQAISAGADMDVLEIDGASNRGIDDIRQLRANVSVKSMRSKYKIYIIDEVHMLTKEAFNALLKTLEEPPPSVKFIFCTTEPNKLPDTILSRCQRFDFGTIQTDMILTRLAQIAEVEGKKVERAAMELVARRAAGSMRDSQSLFDQVLAFGGTEITAADVHRLLGTAPDDRLVQLLDAVIRHNGGEALQLLNQALAEGVQLGELTDQVLNYLRDLLILSVGAQGVSLLSVGSAELPRLEQQAKNWGQRTITAALQVWAETKLRMQRVNYARAIAELGLVRLSQLADLDSLGDLLVAVRSGNASLPAPAGRPLPVPEKKDDSARPLVAAVARPTAEESHKAVPGEASPVPHVSTPQKTVPLETGSELQFWTEMVSGIKDTLRDHARRACSAAISGPNHLVVAFSKSYDYHRVYCERPECLARLEKLARELSGEPIRITFRTVEEAESDKPPPTPLATGAKEEMARRVEAEQDPLVKKALELFGGRVEIAGR